MIRADLHNHSFYSPDSISPPKQMLQAARMRKIDVLAVTDHNTIAGGLATRDLAAKSYPQVRVIVGEEVRTREGEILGLFLSEDVPRDLSAEETIERIHAQGGVAGAPHPFDTFRSGLKPEIIDRIAPMLDFIEGFNARMMSSGPNERSAELAKKYDRPVSAASDAHSPGEIGRAWVEMPDFATPTEFIASLKSGALHGKLSSPFIHLISRYATIRRKLGWKPVK